MEALSPTETNEGSDTRTSNPIRSRVLVADLAAGDVVDLGHVFTVASVSPQPYSDWDDIRVAVRLRDQLGNVSEVLWADYHTVTVLR